MRKAAPGCLYSPGSGGGGRRRGALRRGAAQQQCEQREASGLQVHRTLPPPLPITCRPILARNAELQISASTNEPLWDGARVDAGAVIDALLGVDRTEAIQDWS